MTCSKSGAPGHLLLPQTESLEDALRQLHVIGGIDRDGAITPDGRAMAGLPLDPALAAAALAAAELGCLPDLLTVAAMLSADTIFAGGRCLAPPLPSSPHSGAVEKCLHMHGAWRASVCQGCRRCRTAAAVELPPQLTCTPWRAWALMRSNGRMVEQLDALVARAVVRPGSGLPALGFWISVAACLKGILGQCCCPPPVLCLPGCACRASGISHGLAACCWSAGSDRHRAPDWARAHRRGPHQIAQPAAAEGGRGGGQGGGATAEGRALLETLLGESLGDHVLLLRLFQAGTLHHTARVLTCTAVRREFSAAAPFIMSLGPPFPFRTIWRRSLKCSGEAARAMNHAHPVSSRGVSALVR